MWSFVVEVINELPLLPTAGGMSSHRVCVHAGGGAVVVVCVYTMDKDSHVSF